MVLVGILVCFWRCFDCEVFFAESPESLRFSAKFLSFYKKSFSLFVVRLGRYKLSSIFFHFLKFSKDQQCCKFSGEYRPDTIKTVKKHFHFPFH